jgi:ABC-type multidrug transport system permease subunit
MLRTVWLLARTELRLTLRERETLIWMFVMPLVFMYFIGTITGGMSGGSGERKDSLVLVAPSDAGFLGDRVQLRLEEQDYAVERKLPDEALTEEGRRLVLPAAFTQTVLAGGEALVVLEGTSSGLGQDFDGVRVGRAVYKTLADVIAATRGGGTASPEALAAIDALPRTLELEVRPAGARKKIPSGYEQTIPGILIMFVMVALLTSGAVLLVIERQQGLLRRLASTPMSRASIVLGKWTAKVSMGVIQIAFAMLAGTLIFDMPWGPDLPMVIAVLVAWALFCSSLGLLLGTFARNEKQAVAVGVLATNIMAALGGCWWPIEITPGWMQTIAGFLPTGWAMDAMHRLISFQAGAASAVPNLLALLAGSAIFGWIAKRTFRFE